MHNYLKASMLSFLMIISGDVLAQQSSLFTQYMFNALAINPAYAGSRNVISATALYRNQWAGVDGAPKTGTFSIDAPLANDRVGAGIQIISDKIGVVRSTGFVVSTAFRIPMNSGSLSFGLQGSASQYKAGFSEVVLDPAGPVTDPGFEDDVDQILYNFGSGIYFNNERFYAGVSVLDFVKNRLNEDSDDGSNLTARQSAHAYIAAGYVFPVGNDFNLKTSGLIKGVIGAPLQADLNATLWIKDIVAIGAEYRSNAAVSALLELRVSQEIRLGYAYDRSITSLRDFNKGSHEFMIRYELSFDRDKMLSPRYF